jgi:hypothetical protein
MINSIKSNKIFPVKPIIVLRTGFYNRIISVTMLEGLHGTGGSAVTMTACRQRTGSSDEACLEPQCVSDWSVTPQQAWDAVRSW